LVGLISLLFQRIKQTVGYHQIVFEQQYLYAATL